MRENCFNGGQRPRPLSSPHLRKGVEVQSIPIRTDLRPPS
jgi:hypothetical protein